MLRKRIEKLEVHMPMSPARLLERLDRQALSQLSGTDRNLVRRMLDATGRRHVWPAQYHQAESRFLESFSLLLREIGIASNTLLNWQKVPEFQTAYREARRAAFAQSIARLQQASSVAVSVLVKTMVDPTAPHSTRVRAADSVLDHAKKAIEIEDIEVRVAALEEAAKEQKR